MLPIWYLVLLPFLKPAKHQGVHSSHIAEAWLGEFLALSKSMPEPVMLKKLKLNGFMKPTRSFRTNTQKRCPFHYRGLECKSRKSRNTWSNRQICPWNTEWSRAKTNRVLPRKCTGHSKHPLPTTKEKTLHMDITRWSTPKSEWLYSLQQKMEKLYTVSKIKTRSWLWLRSWTFYYQFRLKLKKTGKTTSHSDVTSIKSLMNIQ